MLVSFLPLSNNHRLLGQTSCNYLRNGCENHTSRFHRCCNVCNPCTAPQGRHQSWEHPPTIPSYHPQHKHDTYCYPCLRTYHRFLKNVTPAHPHQLVAFVILHSHRRFISAGMSCPRFLLPVQCVPPASPQSRKLDALRLAPSSETKVYVITFEYPISLAILTQAPYNLEQAFRVPSVQTLLISRVLPSSRCLETGLPHIATPTRESPSLHEIANLHPLGAL